MARFTLSLKRGTKGLGFNIIGGKDMPNSDGDHGIFVSKIKKDGAAHEDGTLQVGDRIIEINSINLESVLHNFAVQTFLDAGNDVKLVVERKEGQNNGNKLSQILAIGIPVAILIAGGICVTSLLIKKYKQ